MDETLSILPNRPLHCITFFTSRTRVDSIYDTSVSAPPKTNAIETRMGRNEKNQRELGMRRQAFFSFSF
jgi:hypothetical protein